MANFQIVLIIPFALREIQRWSSLAAFRLRSGHCSDCGLRPLRPRSDAPPCYFLSSGSRRVASRRHPAAAAWVTVVASPPPRRRAHAPRRPAKPRDAVPHAHARHRVHP